MKISILVFVSLLLACSTKTETPEISKKTKVEVEKKEKPKTVEKPKEEKKEVAKKVEKKDPSMPFLERKYIKKERPKSIKVSGVEKHALRWDDKNGENWLILSESQKTSDHHGTKYTEAQNLYATHATVNGSETKVIRNLKELKPDCEFDWSASFDPRSISVLDLDKDGYGDATFAYRTNCTSDVSPGTYKLFVLENGEKNVLRGTELLEQKSYRQPGDGTFKSEGFKSEALLTHAKSVWEKTKIAKSSK